MGQPEMISTEKFPSLKQGLEASPLRVPTTAMPQLYLTVDQTVPEGGGELRCISSFGGYDYPYLSSAGRGIVLETISHLIPKRTRGRNVLYLHARIMFK